MFVTEYVGIVLFNCRVGECIQDLFGTSEINHDLEEPGCGLEDNINII